MTGMYLTMHPLIRLDWLRDLKNCKSRTPYNECYLRFVGQTVDAIGHYSSFRHYLRPARLRVRRSVRRHLQLSLNLRYLSKPHFNAESKLPSQSIAARAAGELLPGLVSIMSLPQLRKTDTPLFSTKQRLRDRKVIPRARARPPQSHSLHSTSRRQNESKEFPLLYRANQFCLQIF